MTAGRAWLPQQNKTRRERLGVTEVALAHIVGVSALTLAQWERGATWPPPAALAAWCEALDQIERERLVELLERHWECG